MSTRRFQLRSGVLPLPKAIASAPGGFNMRLSQGDTIDLEPHQIDRFIRQRIRAGDLVEVTGDKKGSAK